MIFSRSGLGRTRQKWEQRLDRLDVLLDELHFAIQDALKFGDDHLSSSHGQHIAVTGVRLTMKMGLYDKTVQIFPLPGERISTTCLTMLTGSSRSQSAKDATNISPDVEYPGWFPNQEHGLNNIPCEDD